MNTITVRFVHRESHAPVLELEEVKASTTVGALRELLMERLASETACMMRVFVKAHVEVEVGGRKRLIELTDEDSETSLNSMSICHLSAVHLDGPLTGDSDGVGQALAVLGAQIHRMDKGLTRTNALLETIVAQNAGQVQSNNLQRVVNQLTLLPSEAYLARQALSAEEGLVYGQLVVMERAEERHQQLLAEAMAGMKKLLIEAHRGPIPFTIDRTTPHTTFTISDDGTAATKIAEGYSTNFRSAKPLTADRHNYAVEIVEDVGESGNIVIGLLPKLSDAQVVMMESGNGYIGSPALGGWGMDGNGTKFGVWQCSPFRFAKGDVVFCDLNFAARTLTLSCGERKAVGTIPSIKEGDELYPAVTMDTEGLQLRKLRTNGLGWILCTVAVLLADAAYTPFMKTVIACHPYYQCEFPECWSHIDQKFALASFLAFTVIGFLGVGLPAALFLLLRRRRSMMEETFLDREHRSKFTEAATGTLKLPEWFRFVSSDTSALAGKYRDLDPRWLFFPSLIVVLKLVTLIPSIFLEPRSLEQRIGCSVVQAVITLVLFAVKAYFPPVMSLTLRAAELHQLTQLGLQSIDLVARNDGNSNAVSFVMVAVTLVYITFCFALAAATVVWPLIEKKLRKRKVRQLFVKHNLPFSGQTTLYVEIYHTQNEGSFPKVVDSKPDVIGAHDVDTVDRPIRYPLNDEAETPIQNPLRRH